ncbi:MAG: (p)ppGpp synthetase [Bacteroidetes bacterium]|nr:(p)ppGpp synthetase [Bacteroidota bacterium]
MKDKILNDFKTKKDTLDAFKNRVINLIVDLLKEKKLNYHQITGRTKDFESLSKKIDRKNGKYNDLHEITDLVGIRIITYLESDVDLIAEILEKEFNVDLKNSSDKRILKADQFGYKSLHYVVSLSDKRAALSEYISYKEIKCEIQIRSILQHAWAEIEHDLGYKGESSIPIDYIRSFNRLAALLETADIEFDRLKREISEYEKEMPKLIKEQPEQVSIDQTSLFSFTETNSVFAEAKEIIAKNMNAQFFPENNYNSIIPRFQLFNINTIKELDDSVLNNKIEYLKFVKDFTKSLSSDLLPSSVPLFYYQHYLISKTENPEKMQEYFDFGETKINGNLRTAQEWIQLYQRIKNLS